MSVVVFYCLKMENLKNYGFKEPKITETHYVEGDGRLLGASILNPSGDFEEWLPIYEPQAEKFETFGCTIWGLQNQTECLHKFLYGDEPNYDERYNYNLAKIVPPGADPQDSYESGRKFGFTQGLLPMTDTLEEFKTPRPMTDRFKEEGKKWKNLYSFDHDWVLTGEPEPEKLRTELKKCPLGVSVTAWIEKDGVYVDNGEPNTHWVVLYKMDSEFYYIFDSYDHSKKKLPIKEHKINYAKRIVLFKRSPEEQLKNAQLSFISILLSYVRKLLSSANQIVAGIFQKRN